jgi:mono/diheme cytochrome c family protein
MKLRLISTTAIMFGIWAALPHHVTAQEAQHGLTRPPTTTPVHDATGLYSSPIASFRKQVRPSVDSLPLPPGFTREQLALGDRVFHGEAANGQCSNCHGIDGAGGPRGTDLKAGNLAWSDGSVGGIKGVMMHNMAIQPGMDGNLQPADLQAVAGYVWAIGRQTQAKQ